MLRGVFRILAIPERLECRVEKLVHVSQWDHVLRAAPWRHKLGICGREREDALQARVAHPVLALQQCRTILGNLV